MPASTKDPARGNAIKAGINVMLPNKAPIKVDKYWLAEPRIDWIVSVGINVRINPIRNTIAMIWPSIFKMIFLDFFIATTVFFLSFTNDIIVRTIATIKKRIVNISKLILLYLIYFHFTDKIMKKVLPMLHI